MYTYKILGLVCLAIGTARTSPVAFTDNGVLADFLRKAQLSAPIKESVVVKRRIFEDDSDRQLKQISLSSLIGDLEKNLFASALSVNKVLMDKEIKVNDAAEHNINKPQSKEETNTNITNTSTSIATTTAESIETFPVTDKVNFQTTERVSQSRGIPTHIIIDRIAIQPHTGGIALTPIFELKSTKKDEGANKDHEITKITISKTEITGLATETPESSSTVNSTSSSSTTISTSTTTEAALENSTTPKIIEQLKEAEEELREKVAEIEAEPVILSARV